MNSKYLFLVAFVIMILTSLLTSCHRETAKTQALENSNSSIIKISTASDPTSLDPRKVRDLETITTLRLFYEGLMRHDADGKLVPALAEKVEISPDMKTFTFMLRDAHWSNGEKITAQDVEYSWKSVLDPQFPAPNSYQFYFIKNAKAAKEGTIPLDDVGIKAIDDRTLAVQLESPTAYFLEMTAFHPFFPINRKWDSLTIAEKDDPHHFIGSGPFIPQTWAHHNVIVAIKNPQYWNAPTVKLDQVQVMTLDANTALQMFQANSLDWTGSPLSEIPADAIPSLKKNDKLGVAPAAGTSFFRINTDKAPFNNVKMRQAFSYAINRKQITEHLLQGGQTPAMALVPKEFGLPKNQFFEDHDTAKAQALFDAALVEMNITADKLPQITINYAPSDRNHKLAQAIQQQWNQTFGINVKLSSLEPKVLYDKLKNKDYFLSIGSWFADIRDPINFLEVFKSKSNSTNNTQWDNAVYAGLLDASTLEADPDKRKQLLVQAEELLIEQMPIIPIFFYTFNYVKSEKVQGVYFSELGYLDFTHAEIINYDLNSLESPE